MIHVADINKVTGYVRGGCSPVGMKKQYKTVFDESVLAQEKSVCFRRAHRHPGVLCSGRPHPCRPGHHGKDHLLNRAEKYVFWDKDGWKILRKIYSNHKSYLKRKTMAKLHKTFESFLAHGNTRENLPQHSLQSHYFAVNCM